MNKVTPKKIRQATAEESSEKPAISMSGWFLAMVTLILLVGGAGFAVMGAYMLAVPMILAAIISLPGFFTVEPNESVVLTFFGNYTGTVKKDGFNWVNPFTSKRAISLRQISLEIPKIKVNDKGGNPIEIGAIAVVKVADTYKAAFVVDDYREFAKEQADAALRDVAAKYAYDGTDDQITLRDDKDEVTADLKDRLGERLADAGIVVVGARIAHLAYAPEIAAVMLKRQQAAAVVAARKEVVKGAVGIVKDTLEEMKNIGVNMDDKDKAALARQLLVVMANEGGAAPVMEIEAR